MELRVFGQILRRRWLLVIIPAGVVLAILLLSYSSPGPLYNAGVRFIVGQEPTKATDVSDEERLANWKTSEYIVNTLADWVKSGQFATLVSQSLAEDGLDVEPLAIRNSVASDSTRSMMTLSMNFGDQALLQAMMETAGQVLLEENAAGLPQLAGEPAQLVQLDEPLVNRVPRSILDQMELPLRIGLALAAGIGLALLAEYLDPTVHDRHELETLGLEVLAEIPKS